MAERLHGRRRIGRAWRPPDLLRLGVARHADVLRNLVVIGRDILVGDRPVERAAVLALDLEVVRQKSRKVGEVVQRRTAHAPARLVDVTERVLALEQEWTARGLDPPAPEIRADEIGELPIRSLPQNADLLASLRQ